MPIKNEKGEVVLFLASHKDVTREKRAAQIDVMLDNNVNGESIPPGDFSILHTDSNSQNLYANGSVEQVFKKPTVILAFWPK